jgi:hypothetical protein
VAVVEDRCRAIVGTGLEGRDKGAGGNLKGARLAHQISVLGDRVDRAPAQGETILVSDDAGENEPGALALLLEDRRERAPELLGQRQGRLHLPPASLSRP